MSAELRTASAGRDGVNPGIGEPTGDVSVDQHRPGLHLISATRC
jgi:hypothetical protein